MSVIQAARDELKRINFDPAETEKLISIMQDFFSEWDSGGAVQIVAPILYKCLLAMPLSPLTGEPDEWMEVGPRVFQNRRCPTVFKDPRFHGGLEAYDLSANNRNPIKFPYDPASSLDRVLAML
jgi:hypothetical protein